MFLRFLFQANIYFDSMDVQEVVENAQYTPTSFLSTLGGAVSLYLGISLVSSMEGLELLIRYIVAIVHEKSSQRKQKK